MNSRLSEYDAMSSAERAEADHDAELLTLLPPGRVEYQPGQQLPNGALCVLADYTDKHSPERPRGSGIVLAQLPPDIGGELNRWATWFATADGITILGSYHQHLYAALGDWCKRSGVRPEGFAPCARC